MPRFLYSLHKFNSKSLVSAKINPNLLLFFRAYSIGYLIEVIPFAVKLIIIKFIKFYQSPSTNLFLNSFSAILRGLLKLFLKALRPSGLGLASGIAIGGARLIETAINHRLKIILRYLKKLSIEKFHLKSQSKQSNLTKNLNQSNLLHPSDHQNTFINVLSTFLAASISSLLAITLLQSKNHPYSYSDQDPLHPTTTPYPTLSIINQSLPSPSKSNHLKLNSQSPTLDFTLFFTVRALDTLFRSIYHNYSPKFLSFLSHCSDTLLFQLSCWRIMSCWFFNPERLPVSYVKWINNLAEMDQRLLKLIRLGRSGQYAYGVRPKNQEISLLGRSIAKSMGRSPELGDPEFISKLSCGIIHGKVGNSESCTINATRRWLKALRPAIGIYLPVFTVPMLLFNRQKLKKQPLASILHVLISTSRSAVFLSSFVGLTWAGVCMGRSNTMNRLIEKTTGQRLSEIELDSSVAPHLGSALSGLSILIEHKKRRGEMALYVATRALCATIDKFIPKCLAIKIKRSKWVSIWVERITFAISIGIITSAIVHHPDYVRGIVKGILKFIIGTTWPSHQGINHTKVLLARKQRNVEEDQKP
ncbi:hypothetical protein O181_046528 [Austropuccinia psidii MF-1]|uniref:Transmembrane protein 135 N-terminal domain-containing protein n=1 Tax=Austropuccinia psidii MF-1 TaxID=1389203 RepID=A0A9Q3HIM6_9BASI|nr:hypothetical protein [Austropuccinia psidii MF-1]